MSFNPLNQQFLGARQAGEELLQGLNNDTDFNPDFPPDVTNDNDTTKDSSATFYYSFKHQRQKGEGDNSLNSDSNSEPLLVPIRTNSPINIPSITSRRSSHNHELHSELNHHQHRIVVDQTINVPLYRRVFHALCLTLTPFIISRIIAFAIIKFDLYPEVFQPPKALEEFLGVLSHLLTFFTTNQLFTTSYSSISESVASSIQSSSSRALSQTLNLPFHSADLSATTSSSSELLQTAIETLAIYSLDHTSSLLPTAFLSSEQQPQPSLELDLEGMILPSPPSTKLSSFSSSSLSSDSQTHEQYLYGDNCKKGEENIASENIKNTNMSVSSQAYASTSMLVDKIIMILVSEMGYKPEWILTRITGFSIFIIYSFLATLVVSFAAVFHSFGFLFIVVRKWNEVWTFFMRLLDKDLFKVGLI